MSIAICSECGSPVEITEGEEWGYCPMCENDQVELKRKTKYNQSLTGTYEVKYDYDEDEDGETVEQVVVDDKKYIDIEYFARIKANLEKALKLACEEINRIEAKFGSAYIRANGYLIDYFKNKAKEMMKSE